MTNQLAPDFIGVDYAAGPSTTLAQRVYIAGPMSGYAELNFPAFHFEAAALRTAGLDVVNPAEINVDPTTGWSACMRADIAELVKCDRIHLLPGWSKSRGATLEHHIGRALGLLVTLAEGAETAPDHFLTLTCPSTVSPEDFVSQFLNRAAKAAEGGSQPTAAVTNVRHEAAVAICQQVADYHQQQLKASVGEHGYHTAVTQAHGYQYLGAQRCVEALRIASRAEG
ncbi:DUF4406 domain-containing protein [Variovorax ureilyticus]|uniref:DUF4406 domain-containing protein n=1 Tax=Variovorax ureilyticus TaxID=1836198 RepID=UPI003D66C8B7